LLPLYYEYLFGQPRIAEYGAYVHVFMLYFDFV